MSLNPGNRTVFRTARLSSVSRISGADEDDDSRAEAPPWHELCLQLLLFTNSLSRSGQSSAFQGGPQRWLCRGERGMVPSDDWSVTEVPTPRNWNLAD